MNFIKEGIKDSMVRKGFCVLELLVALSILGILSVFVLKTTLVNMKNYKLSRKNSTQYLYIDEAFNFINSEFSKAKKCTVDKNTIKIERIDNKGSNFIRKDTDGDIIISYGNKYSRNNNNIVKNVKDFTALEKGEVVYISIMDRYGKIYKRCLKKRE
ncbi:prepilin-type N-terminal cleavage/methylation domain-containing protein [Clostridium oceanicum]